jgi:(1->4)-alpha-D-glucan 1-alpha-D-glucosylmutase
VARPGRAAWSRRLTSPIPADMAGEGVRRSGRPRRLLGTYRLQLRREFGFDDAAALCGYLGDLGVSHLYCSPSLQAAPGSAHGYDVVDPSRLSSELGGEEGFARLCAAASAAGLRLLLDVVPNHMAARPENPWWWDVLAHGEGSAVARHFDVDWESRLEPSLRGRVLLPVLGDHLGRCVESGDVRIEGEVVRYPGGIAPLAAVQGDSVLSVLQRQPYRLARWRLGPRILNWRRFFDITSLVALRAEQPETFEATHALTLDLVRRGDVDGLRVDHVDGLRDPLAYLRRLRQACGEDTWIVVEKILAADESLPSEWPVQGTTGYEFCALATRLLVHPDGESPLLALHGSLGGAVDLDAEVRRAKRQIMATSLQADVDRLALLLHDVCAVRPRHGDHGLDELRAALVELIAALPVYRTYAVAGRDASAEDAARLRGACRAALAARPDLDAELLELVCRLVLDAAAREGDAAALELVQRFQQVSSAVMAKGVEDTVFYRVVPLAALNEVGGAPLPFALSLDDFHRHNARVQQHWPEALLATTTHDTKRSEDVRARLALLAEMPAEWEATVRAWHGRNAVHRSGPDLPDAVAEHLLYQSMVGAWPVDRERMLAYMEKASREAGLHTSWTDPSPEYDSALRRLVEGVYRDEPFLAAVEELVRRLTEPGRVNALALALLKLASPGVPDIYQGCESWALSLVDPDNRRPVDYASRRALLEQSRRVCAAEAWRRHAGSGLPKLLLVRRALRLRARHPELFDARGAYLPLPARGGRADHVVAFARGESPGAVAVVPRFPLRLRGDWQDTALALPAGEWHDQLTGAVRRGEVAVAELLRDFPVALLAREAFTEPAP